MKVFLSSNIEHYRYTGEALQEAGILERYVSSAFYKKRPWYYNLSGENKAWIENRINSSFDFNKVYPFKIYDILYRMIKSNKFINHIINKDQIDLIFNFIFDLYCYYNLSLSRDITHFHYVSSIGYESAIKAKKKFNCKIIVDDRAEHKGFLANILEEEYKKLDLNFDKKLFWTVDSRKDYEIADYIITPSNYSKFTFERQGVPSEKLHIIPYGCNITRFFNGKRADDNIFRVVHVGLICVRKGIHYLIEAFKKFDRPNTELILVGNVEKGMEKIMYNLPANIKHIQYIPNSQLNKLYSKSDVFVLPSLSDSFSLATLEAMASGLPVIISENVGAKDFISEGENGFIIPIRNVLEITYKLDLLYNSKSLTKRMGENARDVAANVTWDQYSERLIDFYKKIQ